MAYRQVWSTSAGIGMRVGILCSIHCIGMTGSSYLGKCHATLHETAKSCGCGKKAVIHAHAVWGACADCCL